jgi:BlaI family transcriptional regulator, penicillinase repressor
MARPPSSQPTDGEMEILKVLWATGPAELGRIRAMVQENRPVATTTVATMLKVMLAKKLVKRSNGERGYLWSARVSRARTATELVRKVLDHVFDGSAHRLVAHLLEEKGLDGLERDEIRKLLESHDAREAGQKNEEAKR